MNDILNLVAHVAFLFIGIGVGFALGIVTVTGRRLAGDLTHVIEGWITVEHVKIAARIKTERDKLGHHPKPSTGKGPAQ